jgi:hypothetical protein
MGHFTETREIVHKMLVQDYGYTIGT